MVVIKEAFAGHAALARLETGDCDPLRRFFFLLSPQTVYRRFLSPIARPDQLERLHLLDVDSRLRVALSAVVDGEIVGVARYSRSAKDATAADLAIVVADDWQRQGLGTRLLAALADTARAAAVERFTFIALPDNRPVVRLLKRLSPEAHFEFGDGLLEGFAPLRAA